MALFQRKKKAQAAEPTKEQRVVPGPTDVQMAGRDFAHVLLHPRITEKATAHGALGVYTFDIAENATKRSIAGAIMAYYKVSPRKIRIVRVPSKVKRSTRTGARGVSGGGRKAYVYLKKGDTITIA